jgi:hypothetical protein
MVIMVVAVGLIAGYGLGTRRDGKPFVKEPVATKADSADVALNLQPSRPSEEEARAETDTVRQTAAHHRVDTVYVAQAEDEEQMAPAGPGYQTIIPPETFIPRPSDPQLIEMLYGNRLFLHHTLMGDRTWIIEPGEITEFNVIGDWMDPAGESWGVRVQFVAQAGDKGIRAFGLLRYYGDGTEGNGYAARDFLVEQVERVGRW